MAIYVKNVAKRRELWKLNDGRFVLVIITRSYEDYDEYTEFATVYLSAEDGSQGVELTSFNADCFSIEEGLKSNLAGA